MKVETDGKIDESDYHSLVSFNYDILTSFGNHRALSNYANSAIKHRSGR